MTILVTGAGTGIGFELVKIFALTDHCHVIALSRNIGHLTEYCDSLEAGKKPDIICFDITSGKDISELASRLKTGKLSIDRLINNAGQLIKKPFEECTGDDFKKMMEVNFYGPVQLTKAMSPFFNREGAHIVNIGSMGGFQGSSKFSGLSAYSTSKAALMNFTECLAEEWKARRISVNALALGSVQTQMLAHAFPGYKAALSAVEMARFIADFTLTGHKYFNGKILPVALSTP